MITAPIELSGSRQKHMPTLLIVHTGGTIGMEANTEGTLVPVAPHKIAQQVPEYKHLSINLHFSSFEKVIDSVDIQPLHWQILARYISKHHENYDGFVLLHGTDTMAYTAAALSYMLEGLQKPVILTGAQISISHPHSDARNNLLGALECACIRIENVPKVQEVAIFFNGKLLRGNRSSKYSSTHFSTYYSPNYPLLGQRNMELVLDDNVLLRPCGRGLRCRANIDPSVGILPIFPGISPAWLQSALSTKALRGLILLSYGTGNPNSDPWLYKSLEKAIQAGIFILNISQCPHGRVIPKKYLSNSKLSALGVVEGKDMCVEAALSKLICLLGRHKDVKMLRKNILIPISGEISL